MMAADGQSRQDRRREERRLIELGRKAIARGLPDPCADEVLIGAGLVLRRQLQDAKCAEPASEAAAVAAELLDRSNALLERDQRVACRRGCAHCCVTVASVSPPEIFRVAGWLRRNRAGSPELGREAVLARCVEKSRPTLAEMFTAKVPCPALVDNECGVHPARPLACRQFFSLSVGACIRKFGHDEGEVPFLEPAIHRGMLIRILLFGAARSLGLPDTAYELAGALRVALCEPQAERRWLAGEDVFAGVLVTARPRDTQESIDRCASLITAAVA